MLYFNILQNVFAFDPFVTKYIFAVSYSANTLSAYNVRHLHMFDLYSADYKSCHVVSSYRMQLNFTSDIYGTMYLACI